MGRRKEEYTVLPPNAHSPCYRIRWGDDPTRSAISLHTCDKREAYRKAEQLLGERKKKTLTLEDYANERNLFVWGKCRYVSNRIAEGYSFPKKTVKQHWSHLHKYLLLKFGSTPLDAIHPTDFEDWRLTLPLANATKNHIRNTFKIVMDLVQKDGHIGFNPILLTHPVDKRQYEARDIFSESDMGTLFFAKEVKVLKIWKRLDWLAFFSVYGTSGMRMGEVRGFCWEQIDWESGTIYVDRAINCDGETGPTKDRRPRLAHLKPRMLRRLRAWQKMSTKTAPQDLVFPGAIEGKPLSKETVIEHFKDGLRRAEIDAGGRNLVSHSFRHTYATETEDGTADVVHDGVLTSALHTTAEMARRYDHPSHKHLLRRAAKRRPASVGTLRLQPRKPTYH
jgi:integrase